MLNRTVLLLAAAVLMATGCKMPGFAEIDEKMSTVSERLDDLEDVVENITERDLSGVSDRLEALEIALGGSAQGGHNAAASFNSLQDGMTEMRQMLESGRDSLSAAYELIESAAATIDSLEDRIDALVAEVASLRSARTSTGVTTGPTRSSTGSSPGRGGTSSSGRSGSTGGATR